MDEGVLEKCNVKLDAAMAIPCIERNIAIENTTRFFSGALDTVVFAAKRLRQRSISNMFEEGERFKSLFNDQEGNPLFGTVLNNLGKCCEVVYDTTPRLGERQTIEPVLTMEKLDES